MNETTAAARKTRLLIVEDNLDTQQIYKDVFERENFSVLVAGDGQKGLAYAQSTLPDIILLDLMLPKMGGMEVLKILRADEETRKIPIVIFSARNDSKDIQLAAELGVEDYSYKAVNTPKQMVARVRAILAPRRFPPSERAIQISLPSTSTPATERLRADLGLGDGFQCSKCNAAVVMELIADNTRSEGHWYAMHCVCSVCRNAY